jgi:adenine phosphoribosyltransferase
MDIKNFIRTVDNFPKPGVKFLDVTSILENPEVFRYTIKWFVKQATNNNVNSIVAIDARGFIWGAAIADELRIPLFLARKPGKLPGEVVTKTYDTEYSTASLSLLKSNSIQGPVLVVDDILATGGTLKATGELLTEYWNISPGQQIHAVLAGLEFLPGISFINQQGYKLTCMTTYS